MNPQISSILSLVFLVIGLVSVWIMLEIQGNPGKREDLKRRILTHRVLGYLFVLLYGIMCVFMIIKTGAYRQELSPRAVLHVSLALFLAPLLLFKILIVKRFSRFFPYLPVLGMLIFSTAFLLNGIAAGNYFLYRSRIPYTTVRETDALDVHIGRKLLGQKCAKCHSLQKIFAASLTMEEWTKTVNRMAQKDIPHIRPHDIKQIIHYLVRRGEGGPSKTVEKEEVPGKELVQKKCVLCHDLKRVDGAKKDRVSWQRTLKRMIENAEEIGMVEYLTKEEEGGILEFLSGPR
jgi:cytochrome c5